MFSLEALFTTGVNGANHQHDVVAGILGFQGRPQKLIDHIVRARHVSVAKGTSHDPDLCDLGLKFYG